MRIQWVLLAAVAIGCSKPAPVVAAPEQRVQEIVRRSKGNWDSLSDADKQTLIQELGRGNEQTARVSFRMRTGGGPGGPPVPGTF
ncbi:MAG TPA: hypothetical protein VGE01_10225 [Fimbriimonas sp.]